MSTEECYWRWVYRMILLMIQEQVEQQGSVVAIQ